MTVSSMSQFSPRIQKRQKKLKHFHVQYEHTQLYYNSPLTSSSNKCKCPTPGQRLSTSPVPSFHKPIQSSHSGNMTTLWFRRSIFPSVLRLVFPMLSANQRQCKIHFSTVMSGGLFTDPSVILSFPFHRLFYLY